MYRIKHKTFGYYLKKHLNIKRGKLTSEDNEFKTDSLKEITKFYHDSNKGSLLNNLIIEFK